MAARLKIGDKVIAITGTDNGEREKVPTVRPREHRTVMEGVDAGKERQTSMGKSGSRRTAITAKLSASSILGAAPGRRTISDEQIREAVRDALRDRAARSSGA